MARSDLLINLIKAMTQGDQTLFQRTLEAIIAEEHSKNHHILADQLSRYLKSNGYQTTKLNNTGTERVINLFYELTPKRKMEDLFLPDVVVSQCKELIEEQQRREVLRSYNLEPRHRVLLSGPPGNGKTSLAESLAFELMLPMYVIRYEGIIGSYLGETANRVKSLIEYVRMHQCLLFLDEFDTLAKERGDVHDTGEIKRVVSSLLLQLDSLPSHVVIVTATNHPELLDRAVWRRFQLRLGLPSPSRAQVEKWFISFQQRLSEPLGFSPRTLADKLYGDSYAELEEFCDDVLRKFVLNSPGTSIRTIISSKLKQWQSRVKPTSASKE